MKFKSNLTSRLCSTCICCCLFVGILLLPNQLAAQALEVLPFFVSPQGEAIVRGDDLPGFEPIRLELGSTSGPPVVLGTFDSDGDGRIFGRIVIPDLDPAVYQLLAFEASVQVASTSFRVTDRPLLALNPSSAAPGTEITATFGPTPAGSVRVVYDDVLIIGPEQHSGGVFETRFLVPADRPKPLGSTVDVRAELLTGGSTAAWAEASFTSQPLEDDVVELIQFSGPTEPLSPGEAFIFSGRVQVPSFRSPTDYEWTLAIETSDGDLIPVNRSPIVMNSIGQFSGVARMPSLLTGLMDEEILETTRLGLVYKTVGAGNSEFLQAVTIEYEPFEVQRLAVNVTRADDGTPVQNAFVLIDGPWLVPQDWTFGSGGNNTNRAGDPNENKATWSAVYAPPNQYQTALQDFIQSITQNANQITDCPVSVASGLTDANGDWETNSVAWLNWLLDTGAQSASQVDINTTIVGPGFATYSIKVSALDQGLGLVNDSGVCTGQRFDFRYDYEQDQWFQRSSLNGPFDLPFDPSIPFPVALPECDGALSIPADPYMPGVPVKDDLVSFNFITGTSETAFKFGPIWSFPNADPSILTVDEIPVLKLPHLSALFGTLDDATLFIEGTEVGSMAVSGPACGSNGQTYSIDLPQFVTQHEGLYRGTIEGTMLGGQSVSKVVFFDIREGPEWINQSGDYITRSIQWRPSKVSLFAEEPMREDEVNQTLGFGIDTLHNSNVSQAFIRQTLLPSGAGDRTRFGNADSTAANENNTDVAVKTNGTGSTNTTRVPFGSMTPITVLDTGKMPLFRYAFGVPPIASATVGCDVWFGADYAYFGDISMTNDRISVNSVNEVTARAGLDVWLDGSILFDLVSLTGYGLPNFELSMPLVITDNQFNSQASQPCFEFALDVAWEAQLGWCPFCIKGGGIENLFAVDQPNGCAISQFQFADRGVPSIALPSIPPIDKTALAVDGLGEASMVWGEGTEFIQVQQFLNGQATVRIALPTGPGAMGIETAYLGLNRQVMVWSQNSLTAEAFRALDGDIGNPLDGDFNTGLNTQHLVYRVRDLSGWSDIMPLTLPGGGDGGVVLAACSAAQSECPQGGEVLAVWVHDASGDINLHDFKLRFAFFDGFSWSPIGEVDPASSAKDVQPAVTYLNGDPVVFWVRNPSVVDDGTTATYDLNQRHLAYRFLRQPAGVQEPIELPQAVASPSIEAFDSDSLVMAFSMATEGDAFLGTRRSLNIAYATQCSGGICQFSGADELLDSSGRRLFVERPKVAVNAQDQAIVTFRQLGVDHATDSDPIGVLQNTGALMQLSFELDPLAVPRPYDPFELSNQGAVNWRVDAIYDPTANAVLASAVQVEDFSDRRNVIVREPIPGVREQRFGGDSGTLVMVERPMLPDFEVLSADLASNAIDPVVGTELAVRLRNNGPITATDVPLATYWNGPAGLGIPGPVLVIDELPGSQLVEAQLTVDLPQSLNINDSHRLYIVINPQGQVIESDGSNNALELVVNGLDVPTNLANVDADNSGTIVIHWDPVEDSRVTGYRVYRRNPDGSILNVGTSKAPGFADFSAYSEQRYEYFVTSHTAQLSESEPSTPILAQTLSQDQLFKDGFE